MSVDLKNVVVRYIRHPNTGRGIGCVVAVNTPQGIKTGWSQCNPLDSFNRKAARSIAIQRAVNPPKTPIVPSSVKFRLYAQMENPFQAPDYKVITVTDPITPMLELVEVVAKRAFGPRENPPIHDTADCNETCNHEPAPIELPPGLSFTENGKHVIDDATGNIVATRVNDQYVAGNVNMVRVEQS